MLGISIYELFVVLIVLLLLIKPEEAQYYLKYIRQLYLYIQKVKSDLHEVMIWDKNYIKGNDNKMYPSYKEMNNNDEEIK